MKDLLQKFLTPAAQQGPQRKKNQLAAQQNRANLPAQPLNAPQSSEAKLPNATVIYGIGASFLFVVAFFLLLGGRWFAALGVCMLGLCLIGFAVHLMKHQG